MNYKNKRPVCPNCGNENIIGVEYSYDNPEHYDGVSEWLCPVCEYREGRFSGKPLAKGEAEKREEAYKKSFN